jgi:hypothetical protein
MGPDAPPISPAQARRMVASISSNVAPLPASGKPLAS